MLLYDLVRHVWNWSEVLWERSWRKFRSAVGLACICCVRGIALRQLELRRSLGSARAGLHACPEFILFLPCREGGYTEDNARSAVSVRHKHISFRPCVVRATFRWIWSGRASENAMPVLPVWHPAFHLRRHRHGRCLQSRYCVECHLLWGYRCHCDGRSLAWPSTLQLWLRRKTRRTQSQSRRSISFRCRRCGCGLLLCGGLRSSSVLFRAQFPTSP